MRENATILGDLTRAFDVSQHPREPLVLSPTPRTALIPAPGSIHPGTAAVTADGHQPL